MQCFEHLPNVMLTAHTDNTRKQRVELVNEDFAMILVSSSSRFSLKIRTTPYLLLNKNGMSDERCLRLLCGSGQSIRFGSRSSNATSALKNHDQKL